MPLDAEGFEIEKGIIQHYEVLKELGDCYATLGRLEEARGCYLQACDLAPQQAGGHVGLGVLQMQQECPEQAHRHFGRALELDAKCSDAYGGLAMIHQQRGDHARAFDLYLKCLELNSDNLVALLGLFQTSCQMGTFSKIIQYLEMYLDKHPGDTSVLFCLATLYAREGRLDEARTSLMTVLALENDKTEARDLLKEVERKIADRATAINV